MYEGSSFYTSLSTLIIVCLFNFSHSCGCEVVHHYCFNLHFPNEQWLTICVYSLEKRLLKCFVGIPWRSSGWDSAISLPPRAWVWSLVGELRSCKLCKVAKKEEKKKFLCQILNWVICLFLLSSKTSLYILYISSISDTQFADIFSHLWVFFFYFLYGALWRTKVLKFNEVQLIHFFLLLFVWFLHLDPWSILIKKGSSLSLFHVHTQLSQHRLLKRLFFPPLNCATS